MKMIATLMTAVALLATPALADGAFTAPCYVKHDGANYFNRTFAKGCTYTGVAGGSALKPGQEGTDLRDKIAAAAVAAADKIGVDINKISDQFNRIALSMLAW